MTYETIVNLIASPTTVSGLTIQGELDKREYETKKKITDDQMEVLQIQRDPFHGAWNYTFSPML
ncbi:MAG: hypothetical protein LBT14_08185 [Treponema sp.]|nr:hypothetical protein [Treponema sp.]